MFRGSLTVEASQEPQGIERNKSFAHSQKQKQNQNKQALLILIFSPAEYSSRMSLINKIVLIHIGLVSLNLSLSRLFIFNPFLY